MLHTHGHTHTLTVTHVHTHTHTHRATHASWLQPIANTYMDDHMREGKPQPISSNFIKPHFLPGRNYA